jgi:hypothetical protein
MGQTPEFAFPKGFALPPRYSVYEQVAGVFVTTPWAFLLLPALVFFGVRAWRAVQTKGPLPQKIVAVLWAGAALFVASSFTEVLPLIAPGATMRYLGDATGALFLLASLGAFATYAALHRVVVARRFAVVVFGAAALASAAVGLALGIHGYYTHFTQHNPALLEKLEKRFSVCRTPKT